MTMRTLRTVLGSAALCVWLGACESSAPVIEPQALADQKSPFKYPVELWDRKVQGEVVILVRVGKTGAVDSTTVFQSSGYPLLDSAAVTGGKELKFVPGRRGTRMLERWVKVPVRFARDTTAEPGISR
jgi:TonB family protein